MSILALQQQFNRKKSFEGGKLHNVDSVIDGSARIAVCEVHGSSASAII